MTTLHHRREIPDMRSAFQHYDTDDRRHGSDSSESDRSYHSGSNSDRSYQTRATSYSGSSAKQPQHVRCNTWDGRTRDAPPQYFDDRQMLESPPASPRSSVETYASTVDSQEDFQMEDNIPDYDVPCYRADTSSSSVMAATPSDFSNLFPSSRVLHIRHDDSTLDGNMNLRVDTGISYEGREYDMTLFHLRMQDLKRREFSLRRYCRNSGREVCHSVRKQNKPAADQRPAFQRSLSNALQSMRPRAERRSSAVPTLASLKRNDSGYASMHSTDSDYADRPTSQYKSDESASPNTVKLEFSNYAQVEVKRLGGKGNRRYEFQYWGVSYSWKRMMRSVDGRDEASYYLMKSGSDQPCARIEPVRLDAWQLQEERESGGWIAPCTMSITDTAVIRSGKDVADTVVAAGLIALVDDTIRSHFHSDTTKHMLIPIPKFGVQYVGPKRLISEMFGRRDANSGEISRPSSSGGPPSAAASVTSSQRPATHSRQPSRNYPR